MEMQVGLIIFGVKYFMLCDQLYKFIFKGCSAQESVSLMKGKVAVWDKANAVIHGQFPSW